MYHSFKYYETNKNDIWVKPHTTQYIITDFCFSLSEHIYPVIVYVIIGKDDPPIPAKICPIIMT